MSDVRIGPAHCRRCGDVVDFPQEHHGYCPQCAKKPHTMPAPPPKLEPMPAMPSMSLTDWFAGMVAGQIVTEWNRAPESRERSIEQGVRGIAKGCYDIADALMAERERRIALTSPPKPLP